MLGPKKEGPKSIITVASLYVTNSMWTYAGVQWYWVGKAEYSLLLVVVCFNVNWGVQQIVLDVCIHLKEDRPSRAQQELLPFPCFLCCISRRFLSYIYTLFILFLCQYLINDVEYCPLANNYKLSNSVRLWCYMCTNVSKSDTLLIEVMYRNGSINCIIIDILFLLASPYRLQYFKERKCYKFFQNFPFRHFSVMQFVFMIYIEVVTVTAERTLTNWNELNTQTWPFTWFM